MNIVCKVFIFLSFLLCSSCGYSNTNSDMIEGLPIATDTVSFDVLGQLKNGVIMIDDIVDLKNKACLLPPNITLKFRGGCIKNGTLIGNETKIKTSKTCFNRVKIEGTWNLPFIKSSLFGDLSYDNALKDVVALSNPKIKNKIVIEEGLYQVTAYKGGDACLLINSGTELVLNGDIILIPNDFSIYDIIKVEGKNIVIRGKGRIVGDKYTHMGKTGEWGMGISILASENVNISNITISECWGDCIYIGEKSNNIVICDCTLSEGRRQGVSITSGKKIKIINCKIEDVYGASPQFAIDIEPNENDIIEDVYVNIHADKCVGGLKINGNAFNSQVKNIFFEKCILKGTQTRYPICLDNANNVKLYRCTVNAKNNIALYANNIDGFYMKNSQCISNNKPSIIIKNCVGEY